MALERKSQSSQQLSNKMRCRFIVARGQSDLWQHLRREFAEVILDRRRGERRWRVQPPALERRQRERRRNSDIDTDLRYRPFVILHEQQGILSR